LEEETNDRGEPAKAAKHSMSKQQAEESGTQKPGCETTKQSAAEQPSGPPKEAAARGGGRRGR
jgi:hypothetical protein